MSHFLYFPNTTSKQFLILYHMLLPLGVRVFRRKGCQSVSHHLRRATQTHTNFVRVYLQVKHFITHLSGFLQLFVHLFSLFHFSLNSFSSCSLFAVFQFISVKPRLPAKLRDGVWGDEAGAQSSSGYRPWRWGMMKKITSHYGFWTI